MSQGGAWDFVPASFAHSTNVQQLDKLTPGKALALLRRFTLLAGQN